MPDAAAARRSEARPGEPALHPDALCAAVHRAFEAFGLYGPDHATTLDALRVAAEEWSNASGTVSTRSIRVTPEGLISDDAAEPGAPVPGRFAGILDALDVIALDADRAPAAPDLAKLFAYAQAASEAASSAGDALPEPFRWRRLAYDSIRSSASTRGRTAGLSWQDLENATRDGQTGGVAEGVLASLAPLSSEGDTETVSAETLAAALQDAPDAETRDAVARVLRAEFAELGLHGADWTLGQGSGERPLSIDQLAELSDVVPIGAVCEAMRRVDAADRAPSKAAVRIFSRLARLAPSEPGRLSEIASLAAGWGNADGEGNAIRDIAELCGETARCDFVPDDYEVKLNAIATHRETEPAPTHRPANAPGALPLDDGDDTADAARVCIALAHAEGASIDAGVLERAGMLIEPLAQRGHLGIVIDLASIAHPLMASPNRDVAEQASALAAASVEPRTLARAVARCTRREAVDAATPQLAALLGKRTPDFLGALLAEESTDLTRRCLSALIDALPESDRGGVLERLTRARPESMARLVGSLNGLDAGSAFELIRTALKGCTGDQSGAIFRALLDLTHAWPESLIVRSLIDPSPEAKLAGAAYIRDRDPDSADLLGRCIVGAIDPAPVSRELAEALAKVLVSAEPPAGIYAARAALGRAATRPFLNAARGGIALERAMRARGHAQHIPVLWTVSPVRLLARCLELRRRGGAS